MKLSIPVLAAALALCALPAAAHAGVVEESANGTLKYRAAGGETNALLVTDVAGVVDVQDSAGVTSRTPLCVKNTSTRVRCALGIRFSEAQLGDRDDTASIRTTRSAAVIDGGNGNDIFFAGLAPAASVVEYRGNRDFDTVNYSGASAGLVVLQDEQFNDGRQSVGDRDNVRRDVENLIGSPFGDRLEGSLSGLVHCIGCSGSTAPQRFTGGLGADVVRGGLNLDTHFMGGGAEGSDTIMPGGSFSIVDYGGRGLPVTVTLGHGTRDDGAAGEGDDIRAGIDTVVGGRGDDTLTQDPASLAFSSLEGGPGVDTLTGGRGGDNIEGGPGSGEPLVGREGNDFIFADDGELDLVGCGSGDNDTAELDGADVTSGCENRRVGKLSLATKAVRAKAGEVARFSLRWQHPQSWRKLAKVELRLSDGRLPLGEVALRPAGKRMAAGGAVTLVRQASRIARSGKAVTARLALRLDGSLAGRELRVDVEATGRDGSRQIERNAGKLRVAR